MKTTRQAYADSSRDEALQFQCDCFQLKYDGWWTRMPIVNGNWEMFSQTERPFRNGNFPSGLNAVIIGEMMQGTQWAQQPEYKDRFFAFDLWELDGVNLEQASYRDRYALLQTLIPQLPKWITLVANYPMTSFEMVWNQQVVTGKFEGVVFRNRFAPVGAPVLRLKRDIEDTYTCTGFEEGAGKHLGRLGALITDKKTDSGEWATVGGGFDDATREKIWKNQSYYLGGQFDVVGKHRFESGLLRHPNFIRWKDR